ncbi:hypothetical protein C8R45DRAFT_1114425 [Mycena sanguinolenta]|nr:hypothetical protein C8R45DRAFT_1114413 [Mycena sanguinolenta]KAJ6449868.1 hypothetical protein C8R45DRAFT_1114425 [Mycena sanguinolenta]
MDSVLKEKSTILVKLPPLIVTRLASLSSGELRSGEGEAVGCHTLKSVAVAAGRVLCASPPQSDLTGLSSDSADSKGPRANPGMYPPCPLDGERSACIGALTSQHAQPTIAVGVARGAARRSPGNTACGSSALPHPASAQFAPLTASWDRSIAAHSRLLGGQICAPNLRWYDLRHRPAQAVGSLQGHCMHSRRSLLGIVNDVAGDTVSSLRYSLGNAASRFCALQHGASTAAQPVLHTSNPVLSKHRPPSPLVRIVQPPATLLRAVGTTTRDH